MPNKIMTTAPALIHIIEDEEKIARLLQDYMHTSQFKTHWINSGEYAVETVQQQSPDIILLDLMLPIKDGISICREVRQFSQVPIVMLTAKVDEIDRILGLEIGADDYICKPFSPREVVARVKAILRRTNRQSTSSGVITDNDFSINTAQMNVLIKGKKLDLTLVEFRLLEKLTSQIERVFSRKQLLDTIYDDHRIVTERTVDSHIKNLRKKINKIDKHVFSIKSVYGVGYKLTNES